MYIVLILIFELLRLTDTHPEYVYLNFLYNIMHVLEENVCPLHSVKVWLV